MATITSATLMDRAVAAGGTLWERRNMSRVYLNRAELTALGADEILSVTRVWIDSTGVHAKSEAYGSDLVREALADLAERLGRVDADGSEVEQQRSDNPTPTYRDGRARRVEQLRAKADRLAAASDALADEATTMADAIPFGQPILVGHHSEGRDRRYRDRIGAKMGRAVAAEREAREATRKADQIEADALGSIYDDDPDAIARLTRKLAILEDRRDRIKRYNVTARRALKADPASTHGDISILTASDVDPHAKAWALDLVDGLRFQPARFGGVMPSYVASNLGGVITATRKRIARLSR